MRRGPDWINAADQEKLPSASGSGGAIGFDSGVPELGPTPDADDPGGSGGTVDGSGGAGGDGSGGSGGISGSGGSQDAGSGGSGGRDAGTGGSGGGTGGRDAGTGGTAAAGPAVEMRVRADAGGSGGSGTRAAPAARAAAAAVARAAAAAVARVEPRAARAAPVDRWSASARRASAAAAASTARARSIPIRAGRFIAARPASRSPLRTVVTGTRGAEAAGDGVAPDPFCEFESIAGTVDPASAGVTSTLTDNYNPVWNELISPKGKTVLASELMNASARWLLWVGDDDGCTDRDGCSAQSVCEVKPPMQARGGKPVTFPFLVSGALGSPGSRGAPRPEGPPRPGREPPEPARRPGRPSSRRSGRRRGWRRPRRARRRKPPWASRYSIQAHLGDVSRISTRPFSLARRRARRPSIDDVDRLEGRAVERRVPLGDEGRDAERQRAARPPPARG